MGQDSNLCRLPSADLQSAAIDRSATHAKLSFVTTNVTPLKSDSRQQESNPQPIAYKAIALPLSYAGSTRKNARQSARAKAYFIVNLMLCQLPSKKCKKNACKNTVSLNKLFPVQSRRQQTNK